MFYTLIGILLFFTCTYLISSALFRRKTNLNDKGISDADDGRQDFLEACLDMLELDNSMTMFFDIGFKLQACGHNSNIQNHMKNGTHVVEIFPHKIADSILSRTIASRKNAIFWNGLWNGASASFAMRTIKDKGTLLTIKWERGK